MKDRQNIGFCNLCKNPQIKLVKSHIIPRSFYPKEMSYLFSSHGSYPTRCPNGIYEYLFCDPCEQLFSQGDNYGERVLKKHQWDEAIDSSIDKWAQYNVGLFSYFVVSLLYRASKSRHRLFQHIQIGKYECMVEDYLLGKCEMPADISYIMFKDVPESAMLIPQKIKIDDIETYAFYLNSYLIYIKVDQREWPADLLYLKPSHNQFFIPKLSRSNSISLKAMAHIANKNTKYLQKHQDNI